MFSLLNVDITLIEVRQRPLQLNLYHESNQGSHPTGWNRGGKLYSDYLSCMVDSDTAGVDHLKFFKRVGVFRVFDMTDDVKHFLTVDRILTGRVVQRG